jgi:hypothetical protein
MKTSKMSSRGCKRRSSSEPFTDEQKSKTGCILKINHKGELQIEYGRMKPSDRKKVEASERAASAPKKGGKDAGDQPVMSAALAQRLSEGLQTAIAAAMKEAPHVAVAALIAGAGSGGALLDIHVKDAPPKWKEGEKDFLQLFEGARSASQAQQVVMLTQIAMQALSIVTFSPVNVPLEGKPLQALVANLPAAAVNRYIAETFNPEDYFKGVNLGTVVAAVRCAIGDDLADKVAKMKKADAVKVAAEQLPKKGWLPPELRTVHYKGPTEKAAPRKDKAAAARKLNRRRLRRRRKQPRKRARSNGLQIASCLAGGHPAVPFASRRLFNKNKRSLTPPMALDRLADELRHLGVRDVDSDVIIMTAMKPGLRGMTLPDQAQPKDPGVVVHWEAGGKERTMAIDIYNRTADNIAAVAEVLKYLRGVERHGGAVIQSQAFAGFDALPPPDDCWKILGVDKAVTLSKQAQFRRQYVMDAFRIAARDGHAAGSDMDRLVRARDEALKQMGLN